MAATKNKHKGQSRTDRQAAAKKAAETRLLRSVVVPNLYVDEGSQAGGDEDRTPVETEVEEATEETTSK